MSALLRILAWTLAVALIALPVVAVVKGWIGAERWPLRTLRVNEGLQRVDVQKLRATVLPYAKAGFFAVRLEDAQREVAKLPWVERAEVRKRWPDVLEVRVLEHRPFARWGEDRLLSQAGRLFPRKGIELPKGLPELRGPDTRVVDVVALYNEARALFAPTGLDVHALALDQRGSWALTLSNGTAVVIGSHEARLRLTRFARLLPQLLSQDARPLLRADLRYTNGFALMWQEPGHKTVLAPFEKGGMGDLLLRTAKSKSPPIPLFQRGRTSGESFSEFRLAASPIPHSPFPIPGSST